MSFAASVERLTEATENFALQAAVNVGNDGSDPSKPLFNSNYLEARREYTTALGEFALATVVATLSHYRSNTDPARNEAVAGKAPRASDADASLGSGGSRRI